MTPEQMLFLQELIQDLKEEVDILTGKLSIAVSALETISKGYDVTAARAVDNALEQIR